MRGWMKHAAEASVNQKRGGGSKNATWYYSRIGGGARGRRLFGNHGRQRGKVPRCCPCHPPTTGAYTIRMLNTVHNRKVVHDSGWKRHHYLDEASFLNWQRI
jgi:hypothetical protein